MPYSQTTLTSGTSAGLTTEMKTALDAALTGSGKYTTVTSAYVQATRTYDVWQNNNGTLDTPGQDGYIWYLIVMIDSGNPARVFLGGALEYDDSTKIAKKPTRGTSAGFSDANGYPAASAGGAEITFPLGTFSPQSVATVGMVGGTSIAGQSTNGGLFRVLVTGQVAWMWWGTTTTAVASQGIGTYQRLHPDTRDAKPLAFIGSSQIGSSVWQAVTSGSNARDVINTKLISTSNTGGDDMYSIAVGVIPTGPDVMFGQYVGSRAVVSRAALTTGAGGGGGTIAPAAGVLLGLAPADFLMFARLASVTLTDTVTVNGKVYVSVTPASTYPGYFVNTQPAV